LYFNYLDTGRKGTDGKAEIFAYNGGLFKPDNTLDSLVLDDELLFKHTKKLSEYDFESQVDVNILGHIFENSLNEIESVNAEIEGTDFDKQKTKRKKDGVFYTPKYITKYIVDNTVGKLCQEKRAELGIIDEEFTAKRQKDTKRLLLEKLETYRAWLLELTICDPACGSGAFLNQALDFLIKEHESVDELQAALLGGAIVFQEIENTILEKNIYGVDLNEESVEIAKLSLWLRTAQPRRKLNSLNDNIKCGNSLIESKAVAGDKAFKWEEEFPEVFKKGGFDVVIGNPPYVRQELFAEYKPYFQDNYETFQGTADLYVYFFEISISKLLSKNGVYSIIVANKWMRANYGSPLRKWLKTKNIIEIVDFGDLPVFENVAAYPLIITVKKSYDNDDNFIVADVDNLNFSDLNDYVKLKGFKVERNTLDDNGWALIDSNKSNLLMKLKKTGVSLREYIDNDIFYGVKTGFNDAFVIDEEKKNELINLDKINSEIIKPFVSGRDISRYNMTFEGKYLIFTRRGVDIEKYPAIKDYLLKYYEDLKPKSNRTDKRGRAPGSYNWYELQSSVGYYSKFDEPKIIYPDISTKGKFFYDETLNLYLTNTAYFLPSDDLSLLGFLNSKLFNFYFSNVSPPIRGGYYRFFSQYMEKVPLVETLKTSDIKNVVCAQIKLKTQNQEANRKFTNYLHSQFKIEKLTKKLQNWYELTFSDFIKELNKAIKTAGGTPLSKLQEMEWMEVFETKKKEALELKAEIDKTDKEIDQMVYELYGLSEEEISIVENS
jgi:type I restriction-modification system DNA methylase subunit